MKEKLSQPSRILLFISGILMIIAIFVPLWRIDMSAPQYPEGLRLLIYPNKIAGDIDIINGLNHYIGMKTIHYEEFIEFKILPYLIGFFGLLFFICGYLANRKLLFGSLILFILFGIGSMVDFWMWEYDYGHNLSPDAAIIVPGMAYQPPLIGFKQLLNFGAFSIPDMGGWIFVGVGFLLIIAVFIEIRAGKSAKNSTVVIAAFFMFIQLSACQNGPIPINVGKDACSFCKMTISDNKFGAELITDKGKIYKFDEYHCLHAFIISGTLTQAQIKEVYISDYFPPNQLINVKQAFFIQSEKIHGPMNGNVAVFSTETGLKKGQELYGGSTLTWKDLSGQ
ncbi:MAG: nitrous oxide reductase accessory protein NosL [Bacteroidia bacterium]|nr:nitrous oxide reductase accessory protein NosL [Bacteroidia bacterium]